jgi:uncharacterized metal-binding protein
MLTRRAMLSEFAFPGACVAAAAMIPGSIAQADPARAEREILAFDGAYRTCRTQRRLDKVETKLMHNHR